VAGKVVQEQSARLALTSGIEVSVLPAFSNGEGTVMGAERKSPVVHFADFTRKMPDVLEPDTRLRFY
jgi:hypothetical protein